MLALLAFEDLTKEVHNAVDDAWTPRCVMRAPDLEELLSSSIGLVQTLRVMHRHKMVLAGMHEHRRHTARFGLANRNDIFNVKAS